MINLTKELEILLNKASRENKSDTPDFILARYLTDCLLAFEQALTTRKLWYRKKGAYIPATIIEGQASAPELLEACKAALLYVNHDEGNKTHGFRLISIGELLEKAISKAEEVG